MTTFQLVAIAGCLGMIFLTAAVVLQRQKVAPRQVLLLWGLLWLVAAAALAVPDAMTYLARRLGIGRGADVLLYFAVLAGCTAAFRLSMAQRRLEQQVTVLVRELAIVRAEATATPSAPVKAPGAAGDAEARL